MKKILIIGGAGFIGSNLVKRLYKNNLVYVVDNLSNGKEKNLPKNIIFIKKDVIQVNNIDFGDLDEIYHAGSLASPPFFEKYPFEIISANTIGTIEVCNLSIKKNAKMLYFSTSEVYGDPLIHPQTENYRGNVKTNSIRSCYDESKRLGETICYNFSRIGCNVRIARIFNTYGDNFSNDGRVVINFINQALNNKPITIYGDGLQTRSFCYISDMIDGLILLMNSPQDIYNIGNPNEITIRYLAEKIKYLTKSNSEIIFKEKVADDPCRRLPDISKIQRFGFIPKITLDNGLLKMIKWYKRYIYE